MTLSDITIQKTTIKDSQNNDIIHYTITDVDGNTLKVSPGDDLYDDIVKLHMVKEFSDELMQGIEEACDALGKPFPMFPWL